MTDDMAINTAPDLERLRALREFFYSQLANGSTSVEAQELTEKQREQLRWEREYDSCRGHI